MFNRALRSLGVIAVLIAFSVRSRDAIGAPVETTQKFFDDTIRPTLREYCLKCHSTEKHKGDMDLERFTAIDEVKHQPKVWLAVLEQLGQNEMPPKDQPQPSADRREQLFDWANAVLD